MAGRKQRALGSTFAPSSACSSSFYRCFKHWLGRSLRRLHGKRRLVGARKRVTHKFSGAQSSCLGPQKLRASLQGTDCSDCNRQYHSGVLHQQGGRYEISLSSCPSVETSVLVPSQGHSPEGKAHSRSLECDSRQAIQAQSSDSDRVFHGSAGVQSVVLQVGPSAGGLVCHKVQSQAPQIRLSGSGPGGLGSGCSESTLGGSGHLCLSSSVPAQPGGIQVGGSRLLQDDPDCSRLAKHALVLGPGKSIGSGPLPAPSLQESGVTAVQRPSA